MPAAYVIALRERMIDPAEMATYTGMAMPTLKDATVLCAYGRQDVLEGAPVEGSVVIRFDSFEAATAWYNSADYQAAKQHRLAGAEYRLIIVEGL